MLQDHTPIAIDKFNGLYGIDSFTDSVPVDRMINGLNTISYGDELRTRDGFDLAITFAAVRQWKLYRRQGEASRVLILNNSGQLFDYVANPAVPILTVVGMTGFAIWFYNNRAYISPHNGISGIPGEFVYVYDGTTIRKAAGSAPSGSSTAVATGAGSIPLGKHIFAWVYETSSGYVTTPGPAQVIEFDGTTAADFSSIPIGPSGTAARRLIASRAIADYNGNELGYEMFFVAGGRINDNSTTVLNGVDFFDGDLIITADYVYDQLGEIPATLFIAPYGQRMVYGGPDSNKNLVYVSKSGEPESISNVAGFLSFDPHETDGVKDATEFRDNLYITKDGKTYTVRDNSYEPATWNPVDLDSAIGANVNGIAQYLDSKGSRVEFFTVADKSGLFKFNGVYEEIPISRNIRNWWKRITQSAFNTIQVVFDQKKFLIYILVPLDGAASPNFIIVGDYENGFAWNTIKWHLWNFTDFSPSSLEIDTDVSTKVTILKVSSLSGNIYEQEVNRRNDNGTAITQLVHLALVGQQTNAIHHFGAVGFRIRGSGNLAVSLVGQDDIDTQVLSTLALSSNPGREYIRPCFFQSEKAAVKLQLTTFDSWFALRKVNLYANVIYNSRPG